MRTYLQKFLWALLLCLLTACNSSNVAQAASIAYPPDGVYSFQPKCAPGAELSTEGQRCGDGVNVVIAPYSSSNKKWRITRINNSQWYKITVDGSNIGLNVDNGRQVNGTNITLWTYSGAWQQFRFLDLGDGYYAVQGNIGGKDNFVMDVAFGKSNTSANVWNAYFYATDAQKWKLVPAKKAQEGEQKQTLRGDVNNDGKVDEADVKMLADYLVENIKSLPNKANADMNNDGKINGLDITALKMELLSRDQKNIKTLSDGWYQISPSHDLGRVLDVWGGETYTNAGANLQTWSNGNGNNQKFYLQNRGNGYFSLKAGHCDLYITADKNNSGANLAMGTWKGSDTQLFQLIDGGNNVYHIVPKANTSLNFDCAGGGKQDGNNVQLWTRESASAHHKWKFTPTDAPKPKTNYNPEGYYDSVESNGDHQITVKGWAFDRDDVNKQLEIHVYVGGGTGSGAESYSIRANKHRPDVNRAFPGVGDYHGFDETITVKRTGNQPVYVYAINIGGGKDNPELGHKTVAIKPIQPTPPPTPQTRTGWIKTNGARVNVRQGPSTGYGSSGKLDNGTQITVETDSNGWSKITSPIVGYVASQYVTFEQPDNDVRQKLLAAVFGRSGGSISCDFDSYVNTKGRHEGIDMILSHGAPVYSAISGVITKAGGDRLNTVAIYDATHNKTVVYLHMNPIATLKVGQSISKGTLLGKQGTKGASSSHVHIEVRDGKRSAAAVSVNDPTLDNSNPYSYWESVL